MKAVSAIATLFAVLLATFAAAAPTAGTVPVDKSEPAAVTLSDESIRKGQVGANFNIAVDALGIGNAIGDAIGKRQNREAWVKSVRNKAYYSAGGKYNALVFNLAVSHTHNLSGVKFYSEATYGNLVYGVWVFERGTFNNYGDGGYINWAFQGSFKRNGMQVNFYPRS